MRTITLDTEEQELITTALSFAEEHWSAFIDRCEERGTLEDDVDAVFSRVQGKV